MCVLFSRMDSGLWIYRFLFVQIENYWTIPSGSTCPPSRVQSFTRSVLIYCVRFLCDWSLRLYRYTVHICCLVASRLFLLWQKKSLWRCFDLLSEEIQIFSLGFPRKTSPPCLSKRACSCSSSYLCRLVIFVLPMPALSVLLLVVVVSLQPRFFYCTRCIR